MKEFKVLLVLFFIFIGAAAFSSENITVRLRKTFKIELNSNPTTGYQWQLAMPLETNSVSLVSSKYIPSKTNLTGSGGKEIWKFKAVKKGKTEISFQYVRPWEHVKPAAVSVYVININ